MIVEHGFSRRQLDLRYPALSNAYRMRALEGEIATIAKTGTGNVKWLITGSSIAYMKYDEYFADLIRIAGGQSGSVLASSNTETRLASTGGPAFHAQSQTQIITARGDSTGNPADWIARSFSTFTSTLNNQSGAVTLDLPTAAVFVLNMTGNITSLAFSNYGYNGQDIEVHLAQDASGSRTLAGINPSIKLAGGALTLTTTTSKRDIVCFRQISASY